MRSAAAAASTPTRPAASPDTAGHEEAVALSNTGFEEGGTGPAPKAWSIENPSMEFRVQEDDVHEGKRALSFATKVLPFSGPLFDKQVPADGVIDKEVGRGLFARIQELAAARGVVFDLRGYPNGNHQVLCHLLRGPDKSSAWMKIPLVILPDGEGWTYREMGWNLPTASPRIGGRVVFMTDGRAISYAESLMSFVEHYKLGEIVGEPTAGANGNVNPFALPEGYSVSWTGMKVVKHDGSQHHTIGILPTVPCQRTLAGIVSGRDEFLEKALEVINK